MLRRFRATTTDSALVPRPAPHAQWFPARLLAAHPRALDFQGHPQVLYGSVPLLGSNSGKRLELQPGSRSSHAEEGYGQETAACAQPAPRPLGKSSHRPGGPGAKDRGLEAAKQSRRSQTAVHAFSAGPGCIRGQCHRGANHTGALRIYQAAGNDLPSPEGHARRPCLSGRGCTGALPREENGE